MRAQIEWKLTTEGWQRYWDHVEETENDGKWKYDAAWDHSNTGGIVLDLARRETDSLSNCSEDHRSVEMVIADQW